MKIRRKVNVIEVEQSLAFYRYLGQVQPKKKHYKGNTVNYKEKYEMKI